jgi:hypothetical protein
LQVVAVAVQPQPVVVVLVDIEHLSVVLHYLLQLKHIQLRLALVVLEEILQEEHLALTLYFQQLHPVVVAVVQEKVLLH